MLHLKFIPKITNKKPNKRIESTNEEKQAEVVRISPSILLRSFKETLEKSKFFQKKDKNSRKDSNIKGRHSYAQASALKIKEILKLKKISPIYLQKN